MVGRLIEVAKSAYQFPLLLDHAGASTLLVNEKFAGLPEGIKPQLPKVKTLTVFLTRSNSGRDA